MGILEIPIPSLVNDSGVPVTGVWDIEAITYKRSNKSACMLQISNGRPDETEMDWRDPRLVFEDSSYRRMDDLPGYVHIEGYLNGKVGVMWTGSIWIAGYSKVVMNVSMMLNLVVDP
jgi:hypothetical protein